MTHAAEVGHGIANNIALAPGDGTYKVIDQSQADANVWIMIQPESTGDFAGAWWKMNADVSQLKEAQGQAPWTGLGHCQVLVEGKMARGQFGTQTSADFETMFAYGYNVGYNLAQAHVGAADFHDFGLTMKVLYEYGNANYQFTEQGLPTKVLPNLVPVADSASIPKLKPYYGDNAQYQKMPKLERPN